MRVKNVNLLLLLLCLITSTVFAQQKAKDNKEAKVNELNENAIVLLRETVAEIDTLRSAENRITFRTEAAGLMWNHDATEGERMFGVVADDFVNLLTQYNATVISFGGLDENVPIYRLRNSSSPKSKAIMRLNSALTVRQVMAGTMAVYDSALAYDFTVRTNNIITDKILRDNLEYQDEKIIAHIIESLSGSNLENTIAFGRKSLKDKFRYKHLDLLKKITLKDKNKGLEFAGELLDAVKTQTKEGTIDAFTAGVFLDFGVENINNHKTNPNLAKLFDSNALRDFAEIFTDILISKKENERVGAMLYEYYPNINKLSPSAANRLKANYRDILSDEEIATYNTSIAKITEASDKAGDKMKGAGEKAGDKMKKAADKMKEDESDFEARQLKKELIENKTNFSDVQLPDEVKQEYIKKANEIIATIQEPKDKMLALMGLARTIKQLGDKAYASELMNEASFLVNQQPQNYEDFLNIWMLAGGYSVIDTDKSFALLENTVYQLNDTIAGFVKVGKFMDLSGEIISQDEVQIGGFEGRLIDDMLRSIKNSDTILGNLARADMIRTKALADRFDRTEVRVLVKMLILKSILDKEKKTIK